jgi:hypothetical protein
MTKLMTSGANINKHPSHAHTHLNTKNLWSRFHTTLFFSDLRMDRISYSVCTWQAFPA